MRTSNFQPLVSIVIPVYNGAEFVAEAISSALSQTYSNIEIVVVNDGSTDQGATERAVRQFDGKVRYFNKPNGGVASALNFAVQASRGEYIAWLSHDDLFTPEKIESQIAKLASMDHEGVVLYSDFALFTTDRNNRQKLTMPGVRPVQFRYWITLMSQLHGCTMLLPKSAFEDFGGFNESLRTTQDYDFWFRAAKKYRFVYQPGVFVLARQHADQGSRKLAKTVRRECDVLLASMVNELSDYELSVGSADSKVVAYAKLAKSMFIRRLWRAYTTAVRKCLASAASSPITQTLRATKILVGDLGWLPVRLVARFVPGVLKIKIRKFVADREIRQASGGSPLRPLRAKFSEVYEKNLFQGTESRSGEGSGLAQTAVVRKELSSLLKTLQVETVLDAPCGDWFWMRECELGIAAYHGADIVPELIAKNRELYGKDTVHFHCLDLASDVLPRVDLVFSRDLLEHLSYDDAFKVLRNMKNTGARYLMTTTFTERHSNIDLADGMWRPLNKQLAPFTFPLPVLLLNEKCTEANGLALRRN
jgi:glycosyltransferase involved in cell wall biosynthesis